MLCVLKGDAVILFSTLSFNVKSGEYRNLSTTNDMIDIFASDAALPLQFLGGTLNHVATLTTLNLKCGERPTNSSTAEASPCSGLRIPVLGTGEAKQLTGHDERMPTKATFDGIDASGLTKEEVRGCVGHSRGLLDILSAFEWDQTDHDQEQFEQNGDDQSFVHGGARHGSFIHRYGHRNLELKM